MLTFLDLQTQVLAYLDQAGDTGHGLDVVKYAINSAHEKRLTQDRWSFMLWPTPIKFTFTTAQSYILHPEAALLTDFWNTATMVPMKETPTRSRFKKGVQDDRHHFEFVQNSPVKSQPGSGVVTVVGSARLKYVGTDNEVYEETVTGGPTSHQVSEILTVTKMDANTLTLTSAAAVQLLSLSATEYGKKYPQIRLFDVGSVGETAEYRFYRKPTILTLDNQIPDVPYPYSRVLVFDALLDMATYNDSTPPAFWLAQAELWDRQLRQHYQEGEQDGAESRSVNITDDYEG